MNISQSKLEHNISLMTPDHHAVFQHIRKSFIENSGKHGLKIVVSGGAAVGKSFLINTVDVWLKLCTSLQQSLLVIL